MTVSTVRDGTTILQNSNDITNVRTGSRRSQNSMSRECNLSSDRKNCGKIAVGSVEEERKNEQVDAFLVNYQDRTYNIGDFLKYHPGGRKVLGRLNNHSLDKAFEENPHSKSAFHLLEEFALDERSRDSKHEDCVNWNAPMLGQVSKLADDYWDWVNLPVNRTVRLFQSDLLEYLSITPWYLVPIVWIPVCLFFLYAGYTTSDSDDAGNGKLRSVMSYAGGLLLWTLMEYILHRKLFHFRPPGNSRILITLHFLLHGIHHKAPLDARRLVFPPSVGVVVAVIFWEVYKIIFPRSMVYFIAAGTVTGYICYDLMHYYLHHGSPNSGSYLYTMKRNHNYHHFSHHDRGFGISSRFWDHIFRTDIRLRQLAKPIEW